MVYAPAPTYYSAPAYAEPVYSAPVQYGPPIVYRRPRVVYQAPVPVPVYNGYGATRVYYDPEPAVYGVPGGRYEAYRGYPDRGYPEYRGRPGYPRDGRWNRGEDRDDDDHRHRH